MCACLLPANLPRLGAYGGGRVASCRVAPAVRGVPRHAGGIDIRRYLLCTVRRPRTLSLRLRWARRGRWRFNGFLLYFRARFAFASSRALGRGAARDERRCHRSQRFSVAGRARKSLYVEGRFRGVRRRPGLVCEEVGYSDLGRAERIADSHGQRRACGLSSRPARPLRVALGSAAQVPLTVRTSLAGGAFVAKGHGAPGLDLGYPREPP